jgi:phosphoglycolate phosphatase
MSSEDGHLSDAYPALLCFDLDGCLVQSDVAIRDGLDAAMAVLGLPPVDDEEARRCIGPPLVANVARLMAAHGVDPTDATGAQRLATAVDAYRTRYQSVGFDLTTPVDGIVGMLDELAASLPVERMVIVTAKPTEMSEVLTTRLGLRRRFAAVFGGPLGVAVEEKPVTLARALASRGVSGADAVMIGDREHDVLAGVACGTATVGVLWGAGHRDELELAGADRIITAPHELPEVLRDLSR